MKAFLNNVSKLSITTQVIAALALAFMLILTLSEVILRALGKPIVGSYELISLTGGIVIGFAIPYTSWVKGHVYVDFLLEFKAKGIINMTVFSIILFSSSWNLYHRVRPVHDRRVSDS
jgi:TRAP-type C4-dicarboxylate transport system permease small subunit